MFSVVIFYLINSCLTLQKLTTYDFLFLSEPIILTRRIRRNKTPRGLVTCVESRYHRSVEKYLLLTYSRSGSGVRVRGRTVTSVRRRLPFSFPYDPGTPGKFEGRDLKIFHFFLFCSPSSSLSVLSLFIRPSFLLTTF